MEALVPGYPLLGHWLHANITSPSGCHPEEHGRAQQHSGTEANIIDVKADGRVRDRARARVMVRVPASDHSKVQQQFHLEAALVEGVGGKLRQARVHPVLHLQPDGLHAQQHQPLEQGLAQPRVCSLCVHVSKHAVDFALHSRSAATSGYIRISHSRDQPSPMIWPYDC